MGNLTRGPDGRWTALDGRHLFRQQKTAGCLYQAVLRRELAERLGLEWGLVHEGAAEVRGVPRSVVDHFSQRRAEFLEHMAAHGGRSAASAEIAALETRRAKQHTPLDRLRLDWVACAGEHGLTLGMVDELLGFGEVREARAPERLPDELTERASTFGRPELLQALAARQPAGARVRDLETMADGLLTDAEAVPLPPAAAKAGVVEARYTTRELLEIEAGLLETARRRRNGNCARVTRFVLDDHLRHHPTLSDQQRQVVRALCGGGDGVSVVRAAAGTGKTFLLDAAREAWRADGHQVVGCALSARAALELEDQAGIPSVTVAAVKRSVSEGHELPNDGVLVVDEAGMVGTRDLALLSEAAACAHTKLVLIGDDRQLPEIDAGGAFHALADQLEAHQLTEVRRQREAWDRDALAALRDGDIERWARAYREHGRITVADNAMDARAALVNDWSLANGEAIMIAPRRADVRDLNDRGRQLLKAQRRLPEAELEIAGRAFAKGDRVMGMRNDRARGILNGQRGIVEEIYPDRGTVQVRLDNGREITLDSGYLGGGHLDHAYAMTAHKAQGATADRTFVLGSEDLYRELGYTALSRHREEARFYVAAADLEPKVDRELPDYDPVIDGLQDLLRRSGAKQLALDSLADRDRVELENERDQLRKTFSDIELPPVDDVEELRRERGRARGALDRTDERIGHLQNLRDNTGLLHFRERRDLDSLLA
ncbi:MAG: AAA family ATPase, partial [Actinomycetota bacterium]|nr:AAA family ATPase [Actinomycetota bacterium]